MMHAKHSSDTGKSYSSRSMNMTELSIEEWNKVFEPIDAFTRQMGKVFKREDNQWEK
jgi:hypothetical protein